MWVESVEQVFISCGHYVARESMFERQMRPRRQSVSGKIESAKGGLSCRQRSYQTAGVKRVSGGPA